MIRHLQTEEMVDSLMDDSYANWSLAGARARIEYLEDLEAETRCHERGWGQREDVQPIVFDRVAIRCEFTEYATEEEVAELGYDDPFTIRFEGGIIVQEC